MMRRSILASCQRSRLPSCRIGQLGLSCRSSRSHGCIPKVLHSRILSTSRPAFSIPHESTQDSAYEKSFSFGSAFLDSLAELSNSTSARNMAEHQIRKIAENAKAIQSRLSNTTDPVSRVINIEFMAYMVSAYRALKENGLPINEIRHLLEEAILKSMEPMSAAVQADIDSHPDAFSLVVGGSKSKEDNFYIAPDFEIERVRDELDSYHIRIRKCWYMDTLSKLEAREIGPAFCAFDRTWYDCIDPKKHGFKFTRPMTIAEGADSCAFNFDRTAKSQPS